MFCVKTFSLSADVSFHLEDEKGEKTHKAGLLIVNVFGTVMLISNSPLNNLRILFYKPV